MIRAVYEGIAFAHRYHVESLIKELGHQPSVIRMSGGACNSLSWVQMFTDILNIPVELVSADELGDLVAQSPLQLAWGCMSRLKMLPVR